MYLIVNPFQVSVGPNQMQSHYLDVASVRHLNSHYLSLRTRSPVDGLRVHRLFLSGVAQATSSISANLKGGIAEDTPLRQREHHLQHRGEEAESDTGVGMIIPEGELGSVAPPDVITTDLEAYTRGILKSREKDWDVMGARRVAEVWNGQMAEGMHRARFGRAAMRKRTASRDMGKDEDMDDSVGGGARGAFEKMTAKTGQALKGGFGLVS